MSALRMICPLFLISMGFGTLIVMGTLIFGFNSIVKTIVPIAVPLAPLNQLMQLWCAVPIPLTINATLMRAATKTPTLKNDSLAVGRIGFQVTLGDEDWDPEDYYPVLWFQEDGEVGEFMRAVQVYTDGPVNYAKAYAAGIGCAAFGGAFIMFILAASLK